MPGAQGNGEPQLGPALDMPDNSAAGDLWNPPDTESTMGISYDNCEAAVGPRAAIPVRIEYYARNPGMMGLHGAMCAVHVQSDC